MDQIAKGNPQDKSLVTQRKSWVASRFTLIEDTGGSKRRCRFPSCTKEYSRGTSHMILKRHWSKLHADINSATVRSVDSSNQVGGLPGQNKSNSRKKQSNLSFNDTSLKCKSSNHNLTTNTIIGKHTNHGKTQIDVKMVAKRLKESVSIHLTIEIYNPKKGGKSYGIITAYSLSDSFEMKSVLLEYRHLPYPDDSASMFEFLRSCISKFNIREKIVSLASNSLTIANAVQEMDKRFRLSKNFNFNTTHIKCFAQFVHVNVQEILRSQESLLETVRKVVNFINTNNFTVRTLPSDDPNSPARLAVENNANTTDNLSANNDPLGKTSGLRLPYDNRTSWNTTYTMIETFLEQRGFIEPTLLYFQNPQDMTNIAIDWDRLYPLIQLLKPFHEIINKFAIDNYTPVSLVAVSLPHLMEHLSSSSWAYDDLGMAAHNFKTQLESYQQNFQSDLTVIAGLLDPRVKDTFVTVEGREYAIDILRRRLDILTQSKSEFQTHQYSTESIWSRIFRSCNYDEVSDYLAQPREHGYSSNLAYWKAHKNVYPSLYTLARALICVQATSVPNDRMFSAAENADKEKKTQIESTNSKELMKSWARYLEK